MASIARNARIAGLWYLLLVVIAPYRLIYVPSALFVRGDATATANNIAANQLMFRLGIVGDLLCGIIVIVLTLALYRLFKDVDQKLAVLVVVIGGILPGTIDFVNTVNDAAALMLATGADFLSAFDKPQRDALAMLFLRLHQQVITGAEILWGLWLFPLAMLIMRSGFLPRFLGVWLIANGVAYLAMSFTGLLAPEHRDVVGTVAFPALLGEVATMLWLVIKGANVRTGDERAGRRGSPAVGG